MKFFKDIARIWAMFVERVLYILDPNKSDEEKDYLRMQIQVERNEKLRIIEQLTARPLTGTDQEVDTVTHQPVNPYIPWRVRRAQLEFEHRIQKLDNKSDPEGIAAGSDTKSGTGKSKTQQDIENLEKELEISNAD